MELRLFLSQPLTLKQADRTSWKEPAIPRRQPGSPCAASRLRLLSPSERSRMQSVACCLVTMSCLNLWTPWTVALPGPWAFPGKTTGRLPFPSPGDPPDPGIEAASPSLAGVSPLSHQGRGSQQASPKCSTNAEWPRDVPLLTTRPRFTSPREKCQHSWDSAGKRGRATTSSPAKLFLTLGVWESPSKHTWKY